MVFVVLNEFDLGIEIHFPRKSDTVRIIGNVIECRYFDTVSAHFRKLRTIRVILIVHFAQLGKSSRHLSSGWLIRCVLCSSQSLAVLVF